MNIGYNCATHPVQNIAVFMRYGKGELLSKHKHFQFLTEDIGEPHLKEQLVAVTTLMRASRSWAGFQRMFDRAFPGEGTQGELDLGLAEEDEA